MEDERLKNKNFIEAWKKAFCGIGYAIRTQRNIKIQLVIAIMVVIRWNALAINNNTMDVYYFRHHASYHNRSNEYINRRKY